MDFDWDDSKARRNEREHRGVKFEEARTCFNDPWQVIADDPDSSRDENRELLIGRSSAGRLLVVCYTMRGERVRIISARKAARKETQAYANRIRL